jgi:hypothetical protein
MKKHSCYEYEIYDWYETNNPNEMPRYAYRIFANEYVNDILEESDECYRTEGLAEEAAKKRIEVLEDGPDDDGYDIQPGFEDHKEF